MRRNTCHALVVLSVVILLDLIPLIAVAQLPHPFDLGSLNGTNGVRFQAIAPMDVLGLGISIVGDVNADGFDDLLIGAPGATDAGDSYLLYGTGSELGSAGEFDLSTLNGNNGVRLHGIDSGDWSGCSVSGAGDVNEDGFADIVIGAYGAAFNAGETYLVYGSSTGIGSGGVFNLAALDGSSGVRLDGPVDSLSGCCVSGAGDINADGFDDFLVGAFLASPGGKTDAGQAFLVFGSSSEIGIGGALDLTTLSASCGVRFDGINQGDSAGYSVCGAGDVNGDGYDDLLIGAVQMLPFPPNPGEVYLVFGTSSAIGGASGVLDLSTLDGSNGVVLRGMNDYDLCGQSVSTAGDFNADGLADILIGAGRLSLWGGNGALEAYLVLGSRSEIGSGGLFNLSTLNGANGFIVDGSDYSGTGMSVSGVGDIDGNGFADVMLSAPGHYHPDDQGAAYFIYGAGSLGATFDPSSLNGTNGIRLDGNGIEPYAGYRVAGGGDFNGDGVPELLTSAVVITTNTGEAYLIYGVGTATTGFYKAYTRAGDAPKRRVPGARCWIDFDAGNGPGGGGTASEETVSIMRTSSGITGLPKLANVSWEVTTNRAGWSSAKVTFKYTDAEIAGLSRTDLKIFQAPAPSGPWTMVPDQSHQAERNQISGTVTSFSHFVLSEGQTGLPTWSDYR